MGGAIYQLNAGLYINDSLFERNTSEQGGGALQVDDGLAMTESRFYTNTAGGIGGALSLFGPSTVTGAEIVGNDAGGRGGGIYVRAPSTNHSRIGNALFHDNWANSFGNNVHLPNTIPSVGTGSVEMAHATIATSRVFTSSGVYIGGSPGASVDLSNSIIASHEIGIVVDGNIAFSSDYNLFDNSTNISTGRPLGANSLTGDPGFVDRTSGNFHLQPTSDAVDTAANAGISVDYEGDPRLLIDGYDMGADEVVPCTPITGVAINGPANGVTGSEYTYSAAVSPTAASDPIVYTWSPVPVVGQGTSTATYQWQQAGSKSVALQVSNCGITAEATAQRTITVDEEVETTRVLLPALRR